MAIRSGWWKRSWRATVLRARPIGRPTGSGLVKPRGAGGRDRTRRCAAPPLRRSLSIRCTGTFANGSRGSRRRQPAKGRWHEPKGQAQSAGDRTGGRSPSAGVAPAATPKAAAAGGRGTGGDLSAHRRALASIGADLGPNLTPVGSVATLLWFVLLRQRGMEVSTWSYIRIGLIVT